jgi:hypothetical protein
MNKYLTLLALVLGLAVTNAQTNTLTSTNELSSGKSAGDWEFTLGGGGENIDGENVFGLDFSISTNPFEKRPEIWVGLAQGLYWEPTFAGSTDLFVDWSQAILPKTFDDSLYLNVGWSGGALYGDYADENPVWRTGPEVTLQYYTSDNAFIYAGANYDVFSSDENEGNWRYSFGIGLTF